MAGQGSDDAPAVASALQAVALQNARALSAWLAGLFALFVLSDALTYTAPANVIFPIDDAVLAAAFLAGWLLARRGVLGAAWGHTASAGLLLAVLPYLAGVLWETGQPLQSAGFALWQVAVGVFLLSWPWAVALLLHRKSVVWGK